MKIPKTHIIDFLRRADVPLFLLGFACAVFGIIAISSATQNNADASTLQSVAVQSFALLIGIGLFIALTIIDIDIIADKWIALFIFSTVLVLLLIPFGTGDSTGNKAWLRFFGIGIQPSEVVKFTYVVLMAKHASYRKEYSDLNSPASVLQLAAHCFFFFALVVLVSSDLGSALLFPIVFLVVMFASGLKLYWFGIGIAGMAALTPLVWSRLEDYQKNRIIAPFRPDLVDPTGFGITWQARQSKLALASGQFSGSGYGQGVQSQSDLFPAKHTDFIFGVIGEEFGMIGCLLVVILLTAIIVRCVYVGLKSRNTMNMLVCLGIASIISFQTFENIGMCMGIAPIIGITLPFFSYGGSSLFSLFAALGIVSGIHYRPKPERFRS